MNVRKWAGISTLLLACLMVPAEDAIVRPPEDHNERELIAFPGPWEFSLPREGVILVRDDQLIDLTDPEKKIDLGYTGTPNIRSWRDICESAQRRGAKTVLLAFDHFFAQYQKGQGDKPRVMTPDRQEYIDQIAKLSQFAKQFGLGLELSVLSPLEIGPGYQSETGESGMWMHFRKGLRDPIGGAYDVQLWRHRKWANNKGPIDIEDAGVRVFAFTGGPFAGNTLQYVNPAFIVELPAPEVEILEGTTQKTGEFEAVRIRVHGVAPTDVKTLDRVLVVQQYRVPEMDYFSESAWPYLKNLIDRYVDAGVILNGLYSDEMHIQQDWHYGSHLEDGEFALRYVSPGLAARYAQNYGEQYADFAKWLVYFTRGQEDASTRTDAKRDVQHVWARDPAGARQAALFRARYNRLLQDGVTDLFTKAKHYAEMRAGHRLQSRAHATWAQSPTIDTWENTSGNANARKYEYTPDFIRSNTVQQVSAACADYFKWGDFLTGNGTDHPEGGWLDRDYYGLALAASMGILNEVPYAYCAHWGMPHEIAQRRNYVVDAYGGNGGITPHTVVQDMQHRDTEVLMLYPFDLVAVDERFGSWMTQYGYANYITADKLLERGEVKDGAIVIADRRFTTLCALFEPFPDGRLLSMMQALANSGGNVIWSGPPPVLGRDGNVILEDWKALFGINHDPEVTEGQHLAGHIVRFEGAAAQVPAQTVLTAFTVDAVYPATPAEGVETLATIDDAIVGTRKTLGAGSLVFLGFRPRDDQSNSLGDNQRTWYHLLHDLGAYPGDGNPAVVSNTTGYIANRFPNGTIAIAPHLISVKEDWPGGFVRNPEEDAEVMKRIQLPSDALQLEDLDIAGHTIRYTGTGAVSLRPDNTGGLLGFAGQSCDGIALDGREFRFAETALGAICFAPVPENRRVPGGAVFMARVQGTGEVKLPAPGLTGAPTAYTEGATLGAKGKEVSASLADGLLTLAITPESSGRWIYVVPGA